MIRASSRFIIVVLPFLLLARERESISRFSQSSSKVITQFWRDCIWVISLSEEVGEGGVVGLVPDCEGCSFLGSE